MSELDFPQLLHLLGVAEDEYVSICHKSSDGRFLTFVGTPAQALMEVESLPEQADIYFGVNPVKGPVRRNGGRGKAEDVTRLAALIADLDFKVAGCGDEETARRIVDQLTAVLGVAPSAVTNSGSGIHVYWPVRDGDITPDNRERILVLQKRWARLVKETARALGATADAVFDLPRVLRVPGTFNCKHDPVLVVCHRSDGMAMPLNDVEARLSTLVVQDQLQNITPPQSNPDDWRYADETCSYVTEMIRGWNSDVPKSGRHQWLLSQSVRLACAVRLGCVSEADHKHGYEVLANRMRRLREATNEGVPDNELLKAFTFGPEIAAAKTEADARAELSGHEHTDALIDEEPFWSARDSLRDMRQFARARRVGPWAMLGCVLSAPVES